MQGIKPCTTDFKHILSKKLKKLITWGFIPHELKKYAKICGVYFINKKIKKSITWGFIPHELKNTQFYAGYKTLLY